MNADRAIFRRSQRNGIWAVVPIKALGQAKQRLSGRYSAEFRRRLVLAMADDVLAALAAVKTLAGIIIVTRDAEAAALARRRGAHLLETEADRGHTRAVMAAASILAAEGAEGMLVLPADVPLVTPDEIGEIVAARPPSPSFTIVPAHDGNGSNAILSMPPNAVPLAFGDNSFAEHCRRARERGIDPRIMISPGLALDIDHPVDLDRFMARGGDTATHGVVRAAMAGQYQDLTTRSAV
ncbi:2-phospho-L-lactate guanylyltransferase [Rhodoligotrophos ferricapiens]|uniref:2-phospho-L-lactate guanylyltransferase n=1 Tax=Rhodoligotrophos ferricapiens TaxID=3069264 RepID=UPI00315CFDC4